MSRHGQGTPPGAQRGIALFISLALLTVLAVGGLATAQTTTLELRMARNRYDAALALHAAEVALSSGEAWLQANAADPQTLFAANGNGLYRAAGYGDAAPWRDADAWRSARTAPDTVPSVSARPRYPRRVARHSHRHRHGDETAAAARCRSLPHHRPWHRRARFRHAADYLRAGPRRRQPGAHRPAFVGGSGALTPIIEALAGRITPWANEPFW